MRGAGKMSSILAARRWLLHVAAGGHEVPFRHQQQQQQQRGVIIKACRRLIHEPRPPDATSGRIYLGVGLQPRFGRLGTHRAHKVDANSFIHLLNTHSVHSGRSRGVQDVQTPDLLFRCPFLKRTYSENMSLRF